MDLVHLLITCTPSPSIQLDVINISVFVVWLETVDTMANAKLPCLKPAMAMCLVSSTIPWPHGPLAFQTFQTI